MKGRREVRYTTTSNAMSGRPIVVLAGWLGCRPKYLHRYEKLYRKHGFDVLSYIATPRMVVGSTFQSIQISSPPSNKNWPSSSSSSATSDDRQIILGNDGDMQALAWHVLGRIHNKQPHCFIYHGFSNGGCFLWEQILRIFQHYCEKKETTGEGEDENSIICRDIVKSLQQRISGVVFDSCPAWYAGVPSTLRVALQYCSLAEKLDILVRYGPGVILYDGKFETEQRDRRCQEMFRTLYEENTLDVPELYLYCENDALTNFEQLHKLVHYREALQVAQKRTSPVMKKVWKNSKHCAHLLSHPKEYEEEIKMFTTACLRRSRL